jgi:L-ascorbate metabolism protein UlaG (beta-lactamase superfamily)
MRLVYFCYTQFHINTMIKFFGLTLLMALIPFNTFSQLQYKTGTITFIGNEGFMIESNDKKVFVDALYNSALAGVQNVDPTIREDIINAVPPFDNSLLFLVSHSHDDHFSKEMNLNYLKNNPNSYLIAPSEIIEKFADDSISKQLISKTPDKLKSTDTTVNGIKVTTYNLVHKLKINIYNVGYFIDIDGFKVFHAGDNVMDDTTEYTNYRINEKQPDVAMLNYTAFWKTDAQRSFVKRYINPRCIFLMHIPVGKAASVKEQVAGLDTTFPPVIVFENSLDTFEVTDTIVRHTVTKIEKSKTETFKVYPNPCKDWCYIYSKSTEASNAHVYNAAGLMISQFKLEKPFTRINTSGLRKGMYFLISKEYSASFLKE